MRYRVGLDVGTASLGVAAFSIDAQNEPVDLVWSHVRIFDEPLEKSQAGLKSKKAGRRAARMQRRQIDRRLSRTKQIAALASILGFQIEPSVDSGASLLAIRAKAAKEKISLSDLIRVFIRLGKRRGYGGVFRPKKEGAVLGEVEGGSNDLNKAMALVAESRGVTSITLGEYLYERWQQGLPTKLKIKEKRDKEDELQNLYALRSHVEVEFEKIWQTQSAFYAQLNAQDDGKTVKEKFKHAIFYQRPLKAVGGMVGQCGLEPTLARAPRAQLAFQRFRIEKTLADLRWGAGKRADKLSSAQRAVIRQLCDEKEVVKFEAIYKALEAAGCPRPATKSLNLERLSRDEIPGNKTNHVFNKLGLSEAWQDLDERTQIQVINFLSDLGSPEQLDDPLWHTRFAKIDGTPRQLPEAFVAFINELKKHEKFDHLSKIQVGTAKFDGGRAPYSIKALSKITEWLDTPWWPEDWADQVDGAKNVDEDGAIRACYREQLQKQRAVTLKDKLDAPPVTGNAVVDGSLRQIRYVMNRMFQELGAPPEQIVVEMAREMSVGVSMRNERESENLKNRKARLEAEEEIRKHGVTVTPSRVRRYLLYVEQGKGHCPYCDNKITLSSALDGAETEYEHILPKSLTQVGLKRSEIVLAHRSCNQEKGNRTPYQAFGHNEERWQIIQMRAKFFADKRAFRKAKLLLLEDFENEVLNDDSIAGFADRQFHQTSWIAKEAAQWLQSVCKTPVSVSRGEMTAGLRRKWKLETVIPQARIDEGLPILDEEGAVVTPEDFAKYRDVWEGHRVLDNHGKLDKARHTDRKLDKRIDHRHHLIDAITIALTSRSLFAQMARQYKSDSERVAINEKPRLRIGEVLPLKNVRDLALKVVRKCPLSIKPDRYPDGAMFKDNPYGRAYSEKDDCFMLTKRSNLIDLVVDLKEKKRKDGVPKKTVEQQARENILSIVSNQIRQIVLTEFEIRLKDGKTVEEAMREPIYQNLYGKKIEIKKVVCFSVYSAEEAAPIEHINYKNPTKSFFKYLRDDGYACMEIRSIENGQIEPRLVDVQEGMQQKSKKKPKNVERYYKGDVVEDITTGLKYRIKKFAASDGKNPRPTIITVRWTDSAEDVGKVKQADGRLDFFNERLIQIKLVTQNV
ncbi:MAG: type II CRISPR RNA-guided endonuclease Cas9 [Methylophilaceae bacterium]